MIESLKKAIDDLKTGKQVDYDSKLFLSLRDIDTNPTRKLMIDSELYRARIIEGTEPIGISKNFFGYDLRGSFVNPCIDKIQPLRANRAKQPRLYCADVNYLSLIEVRPKVGQRVSMATLKVNDILTILDLTLFHIGFDMPEEKQALFRELSLLFATPVNTADNKDDYLITQEIADFIEKLGYDGIAYSSSLTPALNKENYNCANLVIFNYHKCLPVKSNVLELQSKYDDTSSNYDYINFVQVDEDEKKLNLISYKENSYDLNFSFNRVNGEQSTNDDIVNKNIFVSVGNNIYNTHIKILNDGKKITFLVGEGLKGIITKNRKVTIQFNMPDSLNNRINDLTLFFDYCSTKRIWFGDRDNPRRGFFSTEISLKEYGVDIEEFKKELEFCKTIKKAFLKMNILDDINMLKLQDIDKRNIDIILNCIYHNCVLNVNKELKRFQILEIQGMKIFLIFDKLDFGKYRVYDYFNKIIIIECTFNDISINTSQFSLLKPSDFIEAKNINFDIIVSSYKQLYSEANPDLPLRAKTDLSNIMSAYDLSQDSRFLHLAESLTDWIKSTRYPYIAKEI